VVSRALIDLVADVAWAERQHGLAAAHARRSDVTAAEGAAR